MPRISGVIAASLLLLPSASGTAALAPLAQDIIEQRQKALLEQAQQQRESLRAPLSVAPLPAVSAPAGGPCQRITQVRWQHAEHLADSVQRALAKPWLNRCLTLADLTRLQREATNAYLQRGYITSRVWLGPQDLSQGTLTLTASEGRIDSITLNGRRALRIASVFPGMTGQVLNLRDIEQGLEQLNRLTSQPVSVDIQPAQRPGYSTLVLKQGRQRLPLSVGLGADNGGQKSSGRDQLNASVTLDNPLNLADQWQLSASHNSDFASSHHSRAINGTFTLPWGWWLLSVQGGWSKQLQSVSSINQRWRYRGESVSQRVNLNRVLWRNARSKLSADAGFSHRRISNRLAGEKLALSSPTLSVLQFGGSFSSQLAGGYLTFSPLINQGLSTLGAGSRASLPPAAPRSRFTKYSLNASYFHPLADRLSLLTSVYGQTTAHNLYASERLSIGGQYSVRGYKEQYLSGNRGAYWRNEVDWQAASLPWLGTLTFSAALDGGWLDRQRGQIEGGTLSGTALGVASQGRRVNQSLTVARPLSWPAALHPDRWVIYWQTGISL